MGREHGFDKTEYEAKKTKDREDENKKKLDKDEFDNNVDKDKTDPESIGKRLVIIEKRLGLR